MGTAAPAPAPPVVERLEAALTLAKRLGYRIRLDSLGGENGGGCEIRGQKWLFVDLSLTPAEQLEQVLAALRDELARLRAAATNSPPRRASASTASSEQTTAPEVNAAASETPKGFLPRWRRWYRMALGRRRQSR